MILRFKIFRKDNIFLIYLFFFRFFVFFDTLLALAAKPLLRWLQVQEPYRQKRKTRTKKYNINWNFLADFKRFYSFFLLFFLKALSLLRNIQNK